MVSLTVHTTVADTEYEASVHLIAPLAALIVLHEKNTRRGVMSSTALDQGDLIQEANAG